MCEIGLDPLKRGKLVAMRTSEPNEEQQSTSDKY